MLKPVAARAGLPVVLSILLVAAALSPVAAAQNPLGIGAGESAPISTGLFAHVMVWINTMQQDFYRSLTGALKAMREEPGKLWVLVGLSFAYGVFHAAGPGHGKAVISSYMLANEVALRRGIVLSFLSSLLQGATAIVLMGLVFMIFRGTSVSMGDATQVLEIASYALISAFGGYLLWKKASPLLIAMAGRTEMQAAHAGSGHTTHGHTPHHGHVHARHHHHGHGDTCDDCGHTHAPDPSLLSGDHFDWRSAGAAIAAVGIRPCSGALIVLTFAFLNQLWIGGIAAVFAMSIGTAITVSTLASLAVIAKGAAMRWAGGGSLGKTIHASVEIAGALLILLLGLLLLSASLSA